MPINQTNERADRYIVDVDHDEWGSLTVPGFPTRFSDTPVNNQLQGPVLGEATEYYLKDVCGYGEEEMQRIVESGAVGEVPGSKGSKGAARARL